MVSVHHYDPYLSGAFHYSLATPAIAQFAARSPAALSGSRRGSELRLNANGESKSVCEGGGGGGGESGGGG